MIVGRGHEQEAIDAVLASARGGTAASLLIVGLPGIGKTTLLDHAEGAARDAGMSAFRVTAVESESGIAGSGLSLLRPLLGSADLTDPWSLLQTISSSAADHPLALLIDDIQWLDEVSLASLAFVLRRLAADTIAIVMGARPEIDDVAELALVPRLAVEGLGSDAAVELLRSVSPRTPPDVAADLARALGHVPLALVEVPSLLADDVLDGTAPAPATLPVGRAVSARYARGVDAMPDRTRRALVIAAAEDSGDPALISRALAHAGLSSADLVPAMDAGLLVRGDVLQFRHPLVRAAVHSSITADERRSAHSLLAQVHQESGDDERRLRHAAAAAAGSDEDLAAELEHAVPVVATRRGVGAAAAMAAHAAALSPRPEDRWRRLVMSMELARHRPASAQIAREVVDRCSDPQLRGRAAVVLADEHLVGRERADLLDDALGWLGRGEAAASVSMSLAWVASQSLDVATLQREAARLQAWHDEGGLPFEAHVTLAFLAFELGRNEEAVQLFETGIALSDALGVDEVPLELLISWVFEPASLDTRSWAEEPLASRRRAASGRLRSTRDPVWLVQADLLEIREARSLGDLARARALTVTALDLLPRDHWLRTDLLEQRAIIEASCGDEAATIAAVAELDLTCSQHNMHLLRLRRCPCLALVHLLAGRPEAALTELAPVAAIHGNAPNGVALASLPLVVEALAALGRRDEARAVAAELELRARCLESPRVRAGVQLGHALATSDDPEQRFQQAAEAADDGWSTWDRARVQLLYGEWLRRSRRPADARDHLRAAARGFRQSDSEPWARRADAELAAAGGAVTPGQPRTVDLTPQELRIALLVAEGLRNEDIAAAVFLSVKTVETHLTHVYRKLGVRGRGGLSAALAR